MGSGKCEAVLLKWLQAFKAMKAAVKPGAFEHEVAAEGEYICRKHGANSFAYTTIVGSGERSTRSSPRRSTKEMKAGEWVMIECAPHQRLCGGTMGKRCPFRENIRPSSATRSTPCERRCASQKKSLNRE